MQRRANYRSPRPPASVYARPPVRVYARPPEPPKRPYVHRHARPVDTAAFKEFAKNLERLNRRLSRQANAFFGWPWDNDWGVFGPAPERENIRLRDERRIRWSAPTTTSDFNSNTPFGTYPVYNLRNDWGSDTTSTMSW